MTVDDIPLPWNSMLQVIVVISIILVLWQIKTAEAVDRLRWQDTRRWVFFMRRAAMMFKLLSLCWLVVYSHGHGWQTWPPFIAFLIAFDVNVIAHVLVMKNDIQRLTRMQPFSNSGRVGAR